MKYKGIGKSEALKETLAEIMKKSQRKYTRNNIKKTYSRWEDEDQEGRYFFNKEFSSIVKWIEAIFGRYDDKNVIPKNGPWPDRDEYRTKRDIEMRGMAVDEVNIIVRLYRYITECFFAYENKAYRDDYIAIFNLFEKVYTELDWDFDDRHKAIKDVYENIWDKEIANRTEEVFRTFLKEHPEDYTDEEIEDIRKSAKHLVVLEMEEYGVSHDSLLGLSKESPDFEINSKYRYVELDNNHRKLRKYFLAIVTSYILSLSGDLKYDDELTEAEIGLIEFLYDINDDEHKEALSNATKDRWELVDEEIRKQIIDYVEKIYCGGISVVSKYTGGRIARENKLRCEWIKFKLYRPVTYRIYSKLEDLKGYFYTAKNLEDTVMETLDYERTEVLSKVEKDLNKMLCKMSEIDDTQDVYLRYITKSIAKKP